MNGNGVVRDVSFGRDCRWLIAVGDAVVGCCCDRAESIEKWLFIVYVERMLMKLSSDANCSVDLMTKAATAVAAAAAAADVSCICRWANIAM